SAVHVVSGLAVLGGGLDAATVDVAHDAGESRVGVVEVPRIARGVLLHLERGGGHTAGVRCLAGSERDPGLAEHGDTTGSGRHVGALGDDLDAVGDKGLGGVFVELVLRGTRQRDLAGHGPDVAVGEELGVGALLDVFADAGAPDFLDLLEEFDVDPGLVVDVTRRIRARDNLAAELVDLLDRVDRDIAGAGDDRGAALDGTADVLGHLG